MPVLDTLRKSLLGGSDSPQTVRCEECGADFSISDAGDAVDVECPFCGSTSVQLRG